MRAAREAWFAGQLDLDPDHLVFLDETAASTNMARRYGRAPRGERCRMAIPHGHYKTTTVTAALRATGLAATALLDGATNKRAIRLFCSAKTGSTATRILDVAPLARAMLTGIGRPGGFRRWTGETKPLSAMKRWLALDR